MNDEILEKYIKEFRNLDIDEIRKRVTRAINAYTPKSKSDSIYKAYQIVRDEKFTEEAESLINDNSICANLDSFISNGFFVCKETGERLMLFEVKDKCLNCNNCAYYKAVSKPSKNDENAKQFDRSVVKILLLDTNDQNVYHDLYYTKLFYEHKMTSIQEEAWEILEEEYPAYHKINKMIAVLIGTFREGEALKLDYITYKDMEKANESCRS